jgi:N-ethylmaleimide reductase
VAITSSSASRVRTSSAMCSSGPKQAGRDDADHWLGQGADLISFGRSYISNPDLVERFRTGLPIAPVDEDTYYQGGDRGYLTYPAYQHSA